MDLKEQIDYWVGRLTIAIGQGKFRDEVNALIQSTAQNAFAAGQAEASKEFWSTSQKQNAELAEILGEPDLVDVLSTVKALMTPANSRRAMPVPPSVLSLIAGFQKTAPVDVNGLAKELGLAVYESSDMPPEQSGKIIKDLEYGGPSGYSIIVNAHEAFVRKRFTVAHEVAHFLLHRNNIGDGLVDDALYRSGLPTLEEVHANRLAADILMPYARIEDAIGRGTKTIDALAKAFKVSPQAMSLRLGVPG